MCPTYKHYFTCAISDYVTFFTQILEDQHFFRV
jgi:hypothetical protein